MRFLNPKLNRFGFEKRRIGPTVTAFGVVRCNENDQLAPGNDPLHLLEELALTDLVADQGSEWLVSRYMFYS